MESPFLTFHILGVFTPESSLIYAICEAYSLFVFFLYTIERVSKIAYSLFKFWVKNFLYTLINKHKL